MFGSEILEVAIGVIFFYILLSLICSAINEWISGIFSLRARNLETAISAYWVALSPGARTTIDPTQTVYVTWTGLTVPSGWTLTAEWYDSTLGWISWVEGTTLDFTKNIWKYEVAFFLTIPVEAVTGTYDFGIQFDSGNS